MQQNKIPQKVKLLVSYDGTDFSGWQKQNDAPSIQATLEGAVEKLFGIPTRVQGSGRTDAGVHAEGQVAHFTAPRELARFNVIRGLQRHLPGTITIVKAWTAPDEFHALHSAEKKTYIYRIINRPTPCAIKQRFTYWETFELNTQILNEMAQFLIGTHDFASFQSSGSVVEHTVRHIFEANWSRQGEMVEFRVTGNGFLKQMVRNMVGTMLDIHKKQKPPESIAEILAAKDRKAAGSTAEAQGLHLLEVYYPSELDKKCLEL